MEISNRIQHIERTLARKEASLPIGTEIISPKDQVDPAVQATWAISLLQRMYVNHGIASDPSKVETAISQGDNRYWFAKRNDQLVAMAGLLSQSDNSMEVGRAVSFDNGTGSFLMLKAAKSHMEQSRTPLVAEVRISDDFEGVPSGEATQVICHGHLGLNVHAAMAAFRHGNPVRNENFAFSSSETIESPTVAELPSNPNVVEMVMDTAVALTGSYFFKDLQIKIGKKISLAPGWQAITQAPFHVVVPASHSNTSLDRALSSASDDKPFTLMAIEAHVKNSGAIIQGLNAGFIPCGFDRNVKENGRLTLWMGKLRSGTLLAPIKILDKFLPPHVVQAIERIHTLLTP